jgi:hypothetical protein
MDETREINLLLMLLKEYIWAKTLVSGPSGASIHVSCVTMQERDSVITFVRR